MALSLTQVTLWLSGCLGHCPCRYGPTNVSRESVRLSVGFGGRAFVLDSTGKTGRLRYVEGWWTASRQQQARNSHWRTISMWLQSGFTKRLQNDTVQLFVEDKNISTPHKSAPHFSASVDLTYALSTTNNFLSQSQFPNKLQIMWYTLCLYFLSP